jgi:hypothetical protein
MAAEKVQRNGVARPKTLGLHHATGSLIIPATVNVHKKLL